MKIFNINRSMKARDRGYLIGMGVTKREIFAVILIYLYFCSFAYSERMQKQTIVSDKLSFKQLFAAYPNSILDKLSKKTDLWVSPKAFSRKILVHVESFTDNDFKILKKVLFDSKSINTAVIGLEFIKSQNSNIEFMGFELITRISIAGNRFFNPNKFYMAFGKKGAAIEPFLTEIIEKTDDDFCREWACELYVDIYYHNTENSDRRHMILSKKRIQEKEFYKKLKTIFFNSQNIEAQIQNKDSIATLLKTSWDKESRYSLKMLAILKLLDTLNSKNLYSNIYRIQTILKTFNYNYNILHRINGSANDLPPVSHAVKLRYLAKTVLNKKMTNTFSWLKKEDGGFSREDIIIAVKKKNRDKIEYMEQVLRSYISKRLRGKLLIGKGTLELELLRYFYFGFWNMAHDNLKDNIITIRNKTQNGITLNLANTPNLTKILVESTIKENDIVEKTKEFYIPPRSAFIWFVPDGEYVLSVNSQNAKKGKNLQFQVKHIVIHDINASFNIY